MEIPSSTTSLNATRYTSSLVGYKDEVFEQNHGVKLLGVDPAAVLDVLKAATRPGKKEDGRSGTQFGQHVPSTGQKTSEYLLLPPYACYTLLLRSQLTPTELSKMARPLSIRQQALATAQVYVRRFYVKVEIRRTNPALVLATALYLACKMEECPQHIRMVLAEARHCWGKLASLLTMHC